MKSRKSSDVMYPKRKKLLKTIILLIAAGILLIMLIAAITIVRTWGRTVIQVDILQNRELIYLSTFAEPPQFAIWLEDPKGGEIKTVFVTHRVAAGDWEGKASVPVALPQWNRLFRENGAEGSAGYHRKASDLIITGATPREDYFTVRVEVNPGSEWICWIEMNLAGDFNEAFPEFDTETFYEDEFSCGQPALLYRAEVRAEEDAVYTPELVAQSVWNDGAVTIEPVSEGVTTAKHVFDTIRFTVIRPRPKLVEKYRMSN